ncbi:MAG TPA: phage holin [Pyrinomonadaceae bacterium]|nr:phage holin [Pyrinomonadaceae bacterium]
MSEIAVPAKATLLSNKTYDALKWVALVALPAVGAFYFGLAPLWDLPKPHEVVGTITLVDALLGALLGLAAKRYNESDEKYDGVLNVNAQNNRLIHQLEIATPPDELGQKDSIMLKVTKVNTP